MIWRQGIIKRTIPISHAPKEELPLKLSGAGYSTLLTPDNKSLPDSLEPIGLMLRTAEWDLGCAYEYMLDVAEDGRRS